MATIKRIGDKVILKNGKVSCTCCATPGECCMYPAQALADGIYSENDLPDFIDFSSRYSGVYSIARNGTNYTAVVDGQTIGVLFYNYGGVSFWNFQDEGGSASGSNCLINGQGNYPVSDQFADTYTFAAEGLSRPSVVVTRRSLCRWDFFEEDPEGGGRYWILEYANDRGPDALWYFRIPSTFPGYKTGLQNSPVGTYTGMGTWTGTIS